MSSYDENYLSQRPQSLCKMCGKCCRVVTTSKSNIELEDLAKSGDIGASDFLELFEAYDSVEDAKEADLETVENILNLLAIDNHVNTNNKLTFYHCRYLQDNNLCSRYDDRKDLCKHFPSTPWAIVPPKCGFEGWLFTKREEIKKRVRKEKEELLELQLLKKRTSDSVKLEKIELVKQKILRNIELYARYGSNDW